MRGRNVTSNSPTDRTPSPGRDGRPAVSVYLWRGLTVLAILVAFIWLARSLGRPGGSAARDLEGPGAAYFTGPVRGAEPKGPDQYMRRQDTHDNMRRLLASALMAATAEGEYEDPGNQTPEDRRRFIAEQFGVPFDNPNSQAPSEMVPPDAEVLAVFEHPAERGVRMVLLRIRKPVGQTLSEFYDRYAEKDGWERITEKPEPSARTPGADTGSDSGWLVGFKRGRMYRFVYAQERRTGDETLVAVYDSSP